MFSLVSFCAVFSQCRQSPSYLGQGSEGGGQGQGHTHAGMQRDSEDEDEDESDDEEGVDELLAAAAKMVSKHTHDWAAAARTWLETV